MKTSSGEKTNRESSITEKGNDVGSKEASRGRSDELAQAKKAIAEYGKVLASRREADRDERYREILKLHRESAEVAIESGEADHVALRLSNRFFKSDSASVNRIIWSIVDYVEECFGYSLSCLKPSVYILSTVKRDRSALGKPDSLALLSAWVDVFQNAAVSKGGTAFGIDGYAAVESLIIPKAPSEYYRKLARDFQTCDYLELDDTKEGEADLDEAGIDELVQRGRRLNYEDRRSVVEAFRKMEVEDYRHVLFERNGLVESKESFITLMATAKKKHDNEEVPLIARAVQHYAEEFGLALLHPSKDGSRLVPVNVYSGLQKQKWRFRVVQADQGQSPLAQKLELPVLTVG